MLVRCAVFLALLAFSFVDSQKYGPEGVINYFDKDGDRRISVEELKPYGGNEFIHQELDIDGNGYVDVEDFKHINTPRKITEWMMTWVDTDKDGLVSPDEFEARFPNEQIVFGILDTNQDDRLSFDEFMELVSRPVETPDDDKKLFRGDDYEEPRRFVQWPRRFWNYR